MTPVPLEFHRETFRDDYTFHNSEHAVRRFPFPFETDFYMYAVNIEPHTPGPVGSVLEHPIDVDEHYVAEMEDRALVLTEDPLRCQSMPHMDLAGWDLLELLMTCMARDYPEHFTLERDGSRWHWVNRPLGIDDTFTFLDTSSLPARPVSGPTPGLDGTRMGPMEYVTRQSQGDFCLLDQRDDDLWMDAGIVTTQADWSLDFDLGMSFMQWHAPVPLAHELGIFDRALRYLLSIRQDTPVRRLNWTLTVHPRLDTSPEKYPEWGPDRARLTRDRVGELMHLRVELQTFFRLPRSNALVFPIRCYLASFDDLVTVPGWGQRLHRVIRDLPPELVDYKGMSRTHDDLVGWLSAYDDAAEGTQR